VELEGKRADGGATEFVNAPSFQLQTGRAKVLDLLRLSSDLGESYAPARCQIQPHTDEGICPWAGSVALSGVAAGRLAGAGDDCALLARDGL
jgi:hypothetical protein